MTSVQPWALEMKIWTTYFLTSLVILQWGFLVTVVEGTVKGNEKIWEKKGSGVKLYVADKAFSLIVLKDLSAAVFTLAWTTQLGSGFPFCL